MATPAYVRVANLRVGNRTRVGVVREVEEMPDRRVLLRFEGSRTVMALDGNTLVTVYVEEKEA